MQPTGAELFTVENYPPEDEEGQEEYEFDERSPRQDVFYRNPTYAQPIPEYRRGEDEVIYQKPASFKDRVREAKEREVNLYKLSKQDRIVINFGFLLF